MKFDKSRYKRLINDYEAFWNHQLKRPIIQVILEDPENEKYTRGELLRQCYDFSIPETEVASNYHDALDLADYYGDAFPHFYMRSTGVLGAFLGQTWNVDSVTRSTGTVWFEELQDRPLAEISPKLDKNNQLYVRSKELIKAFQDLYDGRIGIGIANLGGIMDIFESMRGATKSLTDILDEPEEVRRIRDCISEAFFIAADEQMSLIDINKTPGYTGWIPLLSQKPYFISQCDYCFMIGPKEYDDFVHDTLVKEANHFDRSFYHLDGPGQIIHLDRILEIEGFDGVQWINGAGAAPLSDPCWFDIYRKVRAAGKLLQVFIWGAEEVPYVDAIVNALGSSEGIAFICYGKKSDWPAFRDLLSRYGVPEV
jgi:hypothetical protein